MEGVLNMAHGGRESKLLIGVKEMLCFESESMLGVFVLKRTELQMVN